MATENLPHNKRKKKRTNWGSLRKLIPVSRDYGYDRGIPIDRYYIEKFLEKNKTDIRGRVLEIKDRDYAKRFGGHKVTCSDVLDIDRSNKSATICADLRDTNVLPKERYDCIILTQTLQYIDNYQVVIKNLHYMLKKNGVLLCSFPSISRIDSDIGEEGDFWRFTKASARYIFKKHFADNKLQIQAYGNIFINICFLEGISVQEIKAQELDYYDKYFPLIICVRAAK